MKNLRIVFMGTPAFSVPTLESLAAGPHDVVAVVTKPDAPRGRGRRVMPTEIATTAERLGIPVAKLGSLRHEESVAAIRAYAPDLVVVVAFRILPPEVLAIPKLGSINLHASLLPKYRGAAPIQRAIMAGERETGVSVFLLEPSVDTGMVIRQRTVDIGPDETYGELYGRLAVVGAGEIVSAVDALANGTAKPVPQVSSLATTAPKLAPGDGCIRWPEDAETIRNVVRGVTPEPGAFTFWRGEQLGILRVDHVPELPSGEPGTIIDADGKRGVAVATGSGALRLTTVKPPGKRAMDGAAWARGARPIVGERFD